jgi:hypothetical protein
MVLVIKITGALGEIRTPAAPPQIRGLSVLI